jgi:hypothetical protein
VRSLKGGGTICAAPLSHLNDCFFNPATALCLTARPNAMRLLWPIVIRIVARTPVLPAVTGRLGSGRPYARLVRKPDPRRAVVERMSHRVAHTKRLMASVPIPRAAPRSAPYQTTKKPRARPRLPAAGPPVSRGRTGPCRPGLERGMRSLIKERLLEAGSFGPICQHGQMGRLERLFEELGATS